MNTFLIEAVSGRLPKNVKMPSSAEVAKILGRLWTICPEGTAASDWEPEGEFYFRKRTPADPVFRVRDFEKSKDVGEPRPAGLDILGTYHHRDSTVTIYVDSCLKAARRYGVLPEELIKVVLVHELSHLMTHRGLALNRKHEKESDHLWEYTAQCATYAHLKEYGEFKALEVFEELSPHQPFIYRTWEGLSAVENLNSKKQTVDVVKSVFRALKKVPAERARIGSDTCYDC